MRGAIAVVLSASVAFSPAAAWSAPNLGVVQGTVTVDGRPLTGVELALVDIASGAIQRTRSDASGAFRVQLPPGKYVLASESRAGLSVGRAPSLLTVSAGQIASTSLELVAAPVALAMQAPPAAGGTTINSDNVACLLAGEFPMIDADIQPAGSVARARLYFKSATSEFYYSEMTLVEGKFRGWMPKPTLAASPITYYVSATTTEFGENRTPEVAAIVVADESECGDKKLAGIGAPPAGLTFFSATTGIAAGIPAGFAAGGLALGAGTIALVAVAVAGTTVAAAAAVGGGASPSPPAPPTPQCPPGSSLAPGSNTICNCPNSPGLPPIPVMVGTQVCPPPSPVPPTLICAPGSSLIPGTNFCACPGAPTVPAVPAGTTPNACAPPCPPGAVLGPGNICVCPGQFIQPEGQPTAAQPQTGNFTIIGPILPINGVCLPCGNSNNLVNFPKEAIDKQADALGRGGIYRACP